MSDPALRRRIVAPSEVVADKPIIRGLRLTVELTLSMLAQGETIESLLEDYPALGLNNIRARLAFARGMVWRSREREVSYRPLRCHRVRVSRPATSTNQN